MAGEPHSQTRGFLDMLQWSTLLITGGLLISLVASEVAIGQAGNLSVLTSVFLLLLAIGLLITSADFFIEGAKNLARTVGIPEVVIGLTIVSIGTSLPEILVTTTASLNSSTDPDLAGLAVGNIYGSVLAQITIVLGIVVLVRPMDVQPDWMKRDGMLMLGAVVLLSIFLLIGGDLRRIEGLILVSCYIIYVTYLLWNRDDLDDDENDGTTPSQLERGWTASAAIVMVIGGLGCAVYAADRLVMFASQIALEVGISEAVIGTTMSGLGTSLPELTVALMAAKRSQGVAIGTLIGSNITDPLLSIGLASLIRPIVLPAEMAPLVLQLIMPATIIGVIACLVAMWTGFRFNRSEGACLVVLYLLFLGLLVLESQGRILTG